MAKLKDGLLVLDRNEGQVLEGARFAWVGINLYDKSIVLTPTNDNAMRTIDDPKQGVIYDFPHEVKETDDGYAIEVMGLEEHIGQNEYTAVPGSVQHIEGIVLPPYLTLKVARDEMPAAQPGATQVYNGPAPKSLAEVVDLINDMSSKELKAYAESLGINLIKKDWRKTIASKVLTYWKKRGVR